MSSVDPDLILTCGCGAQGTYEELFDDSGLDETCGGTGYLNCTCGGDFCVCHYHGGTDCDGCEECEGDAESWDDYGDCDNTDTEDSVYEEDEYHAG